MEKEKISELIVQTKKDNSLAKKPCLGTGSKGIHHYTRTFNGTKQSYCKYCGCLFPRVPCNSFLI